MFWAALTLPASEQAKSWLRPRGTSIANEQSPGVSQGSSIVRTTVNGPCTLPGAQRLKKNGNNCTSKSSAAQPYNKYVTINSEGSHAPDSGVVLRL